MDKKLRSAYLALNKAIHDKELPPKRQAKKFIDATYWKAHYIRELQSIGAYLDIIK